MMNRRSFLASLLAAPLPLLGIREPAKLIPLEDGLIFFCGERTLWHTWRGRIVGISRYALGAKGSLRPIAFSKEQILERLRVAFAKMDWKPLLSPSGEKA